MEQYSRIAKIIGDDNLKKLKSAKVLIVGLGGVGGNALEIIARSGISNIVIADFDVFEESNLNRQILCLKNSITKKKVEVAKERILAINPNCNLTIIDDKINEEVLNKYKINVNYIIDACDDVKAKVSLIKYAINNNMKIISCCGTGNRLNPESLKVSNIWETDHDPLARKLRYELRKNAINYKLPVVISKEKPSIKTKGFVGSMAMVPNAAGILLASYVINDILNSN